MPERAGVSMVRACALADVKSAAAHLWIIGYFERGTVNLHEGSCS